MASSLFHLLVASLCIGFLSAAPANETVTYGNIENSSTSNPSDPQVLSSVDIIVPHGSNTSAAIHMSPVEVDYDHHEGDGHHSSSSSTGTSSTESVNSTSFSPLSFDDEKTTEAGPTTKATHIMVIPRKNVTMQSENSTFSNEEDSSATSYEHDYHSKGSSVSSASILVILATISWAVLIQ